MNQRKVLFVCIGNSCRSQMAEGFARTYGSDVMTAESAGLAPAPGIAGLTREVMAEKNIHLDQQFSKSLMEVDLASVDLIINISGHPFPIKPRAPVRDWKVEDPIGGKKKTHQAVAAQLEGLVMQLILELRRKP
ncbi:MAG: hypothetical protein GY953_54425 [bacterium]|nr:hypothetical protein [bacterium]